MMTDHKRGCQGREYVCTCGYDDKRDAEIDRLRALVASPKRDETDESISDDDLAYNFGLEVRYAIAASGADPLQHIPEVDAIVKRRVGEIRAALSAKEATAEAHERGIEAAVRAWFKSANMEKAISAYQAALSAKETSE